MDNNTERFFPRTIHAQAHDLCRQGLPLAIEGPQGCGKSALARRLAEEYPAMRIVEDDAQIVRLAPRAAFAETPSADSAPAKPLSPRVLRMYPMSGFEQGIFPGGVSLRALMDSASPNGLPPKRPSLPFATPMPVRRLIMPQLLEYMIHGGWPQNCGEPLAASQQNAYLYIQDLLRTDIAQATSAASAHPSGLNVLLRSLGASTASSPSLAWLTRQVKTKRPELGRKTVAQWMEALDRLHIIDKQEAWRPPLTNRARPTSRPLIHICDTSLTAHLVYASPPTLMFNLARAASIFNSFVYQQLCALASPLGARVLHYRDSYAHAIGNIVVSEDGRWMPIAVRLAHVDCDAASAQLVAALRAIDTRELGPMAPPAIIVGHGDSVEADERGVLVIPVHALEP